VGQRSQVRWSQGRSIPTGGPRQGLQAGGTA
jgi:hypothetical protein